MSDSEQSNGSGSTGEQAEYRLNHIYLKDASFETPNTPDIFIKPRTGAPEMSMDLASRQKKLDGTTYEVILHVRVHMAIEGSSLYLAEVYHAAIVTVKGYPNNETRRILGAVCPAELFPYAREAISSLVSRSGFPMVVLQPVDFEQLYAQSSSDQK
jgi:preprotein translocase subunit SecB